MIPFRTCRVCLQKSPKTDLVRIVRKPDGTLVIDKKGGTPGRGVYLCSDCLRSSKFENKKAKHSLFHALKASPDSKIIEELLHHYDKSPSKK